MYENHRKNFNRDDHREFGERYRGDDRWRSDDRDGRTRYWTERHDDDDDGWNERNRRLGYASTYREDDQGRYARHSNRARDRWRDEGDAGYAHDPSHHRSGQGAASYGYGAGQPYREDESRFFTGQQNSWAQRSPYGARGQGYGADYRRHSYANRDEDERGFWDRATDEVASWFGDEDATRRREADHRGRGPRDYVRSDERIREDANDRLTDDYRIDAGNVTLIVQGGEVTLNGTVPSREEKRRAEDVIERISGVKHVQNNLRVDPTANASTYEANWTLNRASTAEGGTLAQAPTKTVPDRETAKP